MTEQKQHSNIGEAWLAIMSEVGYVQKLGKNIAQNYKYAGEAQLIEALRPALLKHGVICMPGGVDVIDCTPVIIGEKKTFRIVAKYTWVYTHVASNTHMQVEVIGEGVDTGDKSAYKAATGALKYALRQPFLIETGDEPEAHEVEEKPRFENAKQRQNYVDTLMQCIVDTKSVDQLNALYLKEKAAIADMQAGEQVESKQAAAILEAFKVRKEQIVTQGVE